MWSNQFNLAPCFTIMVDKTTDVSNKEQVVVCIRWVDTKSESCEEFIGLYQVDCTEASTLVATILDVLKIFIFFGISLGELLLSKCDDLSKILQASGMSAAEGNC